MITKAQIQFLRSLEHKRVRQETGCFIVEGDKFVREALQLPVRGSFQVKTVCGLAKWMDSNISVQENHNFDLITVSPRELERISQLKTPNQALAVISYDLLFTPEFNFSQDLLIGLHQVQDPGNVGTIIRLADWFGIGGVIASADTADFFSPKVVQASMGSIFRVPIVTTDLPGFITSLPRTFPVYGTHLEGQNLYHAEIEKKGLIVFGNESKGMGDEISGFASLNLRIPDFSSGETKPESLNVAIAAAIVCSEFRRRGNG